MGLEYIITIFGFVVIIYFVEKPKSTKKKVKDKLTKEIKVKGFPPQTSCSGWLPYL